MTLLARLASDVQLMFRRPPRQQYGALCYRVRNGDKLEVLLMTSRDTGRWVIPKGWPINGKCAHEVAAQEALEEAGVKGPVETETLGAYTYPKMLRDGVRVSCKVQVYPLEVTDMAKNFKEKGERTIEWVSFDEAAGRVREPELRHLFLAFKRKLTDRLSANAAKQIPAE
ncbi:NUDIX hydrolase [Rhizobium lentis]|uniref:8-oxo-dGTP pyrophosphatase MutT (NUDIX family) n=1 Tax=Rhizobium lentis TaxID=1138194 RepID=A0A7W8XHL5_9HYPH|nr:NUDIX hydrolase [Rhizobium lentis]MBB4576050.1 8-oxo-dGTP pyrophosphatase MutT (NUDIX family) [Rhizobium lentis]MBB5552359.1 8-oxo-dGTP pyrophosphatase MutT (NUDIX family) [Rhizobium lentis]MBB5563032.1 8-oxo-dGTP pyrophosphatase MutT (NUDIX family) [Rhizobium lentis]MBB5569176.1 8-oxo-dGTP pyrophosphatase MutT (NUDIX family) [Rhizobium lentis]